jgi:polyferredoxin
MVDPSVILAPLAAGMAISIAYLVKWASEARTPLRAGAVVFLLLMMVGMLLGATLYYVHPSFSSLVEGIWVASALMSLSVVVVFLSFLREAQSDSGRTVPPGAGSGVGPMFVGSVVALVLANELLMGWTFQAAAGQAPVLAGTGLSAFVQLFAASVNSPWFLFTMSAEMVLTAVLLRSRLSPPVFVVLVSQSFLMLFSPPALHSAGWTSLSIYVSSAAMIALFVYLMEYLYHHHQVGAGFSTYLLELLSIYALMMAGLFLWFYYGDGSAFALSIVLEMIVFFGAVIWPEGLTEKLAAPWQLRPNWAFGVLALIFVAEIFMGALLDAQVEPSQFTGALMVLPLSGSVPTILLNGVSNGFWFLATVAASTWFLAMMGVEMGALVVFKLRETRHLENRVRLVLMLGCYSAFAVFYPSIYLGLVAPQAPDPSTVPVLGWPMGLGSYPLATVVFVVVLVTYLITGTLVVLFGRRVICSVFCTAPLMYQGTTIDAMKTFNRSGPVGRKYLSSRFSQTYSVTTGLVLGSLVVTSLLSYLDTTGTLNFYIEGTDPAVFFFALYFSVLWYLMFVTIPYTGNYNCVTMGWCYTGTIAQAFQKVGFFKLKVHDKQVCRDCTTLDCAKGCPVGLVDMPGHFRTKGEFRSSKCCGVGDCIEACPYDNLYISDVRHWLRARLGLPEKPVPTNRLPMVRVSPSASPTRVSPTSIPGTARRTSLAGPLAPAEGRP